MNIEKIPIHLIKIDKYAIQKATFELIKFKMSGGVLPPIKVAKLQNGGYIIRDGRHRLTAAKIMGEKVILARFKNEFLKKNN